MRFGDFIKQVIGQGLRVKGQVNRSRVRGQRSGVIGQGLRVKG
jgi:hypothetical protein